ncbi:MAG: hypothetical protein H3C43_01055, partial [Leptonema sp. (in: Bacteria)]|nr:hypothetical protein [Leptonema sp. (in: bacteria)]
MNVAFQTQTFAVLNSVEARQSQAESFRELLDFVQGPEFEQTLQWTGPIEGVVPGMTLDELADVYYSTVFTQVEATYSIGELELLSDEIASNLYTLIDLREKALLTDQTISENELDYLTVRTIQFREQVLELLERRRKEALLGVRLPPPEKPGMVARLWRRLFPTLEASPLTGVLEQIPGVGDFLESVQYANAGFTKAAMYNAVGTAILFNKIGVPTSYSQTVGCGCKPQGLDAPIEYAMPTEIPRHQMGYVVFWGDSMFETLRATTPDWNSIFFPEYAGKIFLHAKGGGTSQNLRDHFNNCGGHAYNTFYPDPATSSHIQLESMRSVVLVGGNDFDIYEPMLRAFPILIPFRINHVLNGLNRVVSYHQAQGADVILVGHTPRPAVRMDLLSLLHGSGGADDRVFGALKTLAERQINAVKGALDKVDSIAPSAVPLGSAAYLYSEGYQYHALGLLAATESGIYANGLAQRIYKEAIIGNLKPHLGWWRPDKTWLNHQLGALTLAMIPFVVQQRNTGFLNPWFHFNDGNALLRGEWWVGNPSLYAEDSIHFFFLGHAMHSNLLAAEMDARGWRTNPMPEYGDRCRYATG